MASPTKLISRRGFTLIELLVVLVMIGLLIGLAESPLHVLTTQIGAHDTTSIYVEALHRAQLLAISGRGDSPWGVLATTSLIVLYKGASYATRDGTYDEQHQTVPFTVGGVTEINFARLTGMPNTSGTTTITVGSGATSTVYINAKGTLTY